MSSKRYVLDSGVFIQAHRFHYRFDFCAGFWDWLQHAHDIGLVHSIKYVQTELVGGNDLLAKWIANGREQMFRDTSSDAASLVCYRDLMNDVTKSSHYTTKAKAEFASVNSADAFLVAYAKAHGHVVVSHEKTDLNRKSAVKVPDIASRIGVSCINTFELLSKHAKGTFEFKA